MAGGALFQGVHKESAAFRLMKQMGWEEGSGLGKDKQGIKKHLAVAKKKDNSGVGANEVHNWTFNTTAFDSLLKNLKVKSNSKEESIEERKEEEKDDGPDEQESGSESDSEDEAEKCVKVLKVCRPQGRYKKMERGKIVQNYSKEDLQSILGKTEEIVEPTPAPVPLFVVEQQQTFVSCKDVNEIEWWGSKLGFVKAGVLGSSMNITEKKQTFTEDDQEQLYKSVQDKATKGRGGLGIADRPKKIAGTYWKGKKITLDTADEEVDEQDRKPDLVRKRKRQIDAGVDGETRLKLKKLCREFLLQAPDQKSSLRKLQKHITAAVGGDAFTDLDRLRKKLLKSSRFTIEGNSISLVPEVAC